MPLKSKAYRARMKNLFLQSKSSPEVLRESDSSQQLPTTPCLSHARKDTVSFDSDLTEIITCFDNLENDLPDLYDSSDSENEDELDDDTEIRELSALEHFAETLQKAQEVATAAEREREKENKRPKRYQGNSKRTRRRHDLKHREFDKEGYILVKEFWEKRRKVNIDPEIPVQEEKDKPEYVSSDEEIEIESSTETVSYHMIRE
jgi:hypothetical protein